MRKTYIIVIMSVLALALISWSLFASIVIYFGFSRFIRRATRGFGQLEYDEDWIADHDLYPSEKVVSNEKTKIEYLGDLYISDHHHQSHQKNLSTI